MRVGIDITPLCNPRTGVGAYCYYLLSALRDGYPEDAFTGVVLSHRAPVLEGSLADLAYRRIPVPTRALYAWWRWVQSPAADARRDNLDVFHATNFVLPPLRNAPGVVTVHDLAFVRMPEHCSPKIVRFFSRATREACGRAEVVLADSESTRDDLTKAWGIARNKIVVAPLAASPDRQPLDRATAQSHVRERYGINGPYLLHVGTIEPRKNLDGLLESFAQIAGKYPHTIVLVGGMGWKAESFRVALHTLGLADRVIQPGYVPDGDLNAFYSAADAFVFPSHYEGFGLPVLDAMACGCPVVAARTSSIPEVAGDAAQLAEPGDPGAFAQALSQVLDDEALRRTLRERGLARAQTFSWQATAEVTMEAYRRAAACA